MPRILKINNSGRSHTKAELSFCPFLLGNINRYAGEPTNPVRSLFVWLQPNLCTHIRNAKSLKLILPVALKPLNWCGGIFILVGRCAFPAETIHASTLESTITPVDVLLCSCWQCMFCEERLQFEFGGVFENADTEPRVVVSCARSISSHGM